MVDGSDPEYVVKCPEKWTTELRSQVEVWEGNVLLLECVIRNAGYDFKWIVRSWGLKAGLKREGRKNFGLEETGRAWTVADLRTIVIAGVIVKRALGDWRQWITFYSYLSASKEFEPFRRTECRTVAEWRMSRAEVFATVVEVNGNLRRLA